MSKESTQQMSTRFVGKISAKTLGFNQDYVKKLTIDDKVGAKRDLFIVTGLITGIKTGVHAEYGPWVKFLGDIAASDVNGEVVRSGELLLPNVVAPVLAAHVEKGRAEAINGAEGKSPKEFLGVECEFEIGVERMASGVGYQFTCTNLKPNAIQEDARGQKLLELMQGRKKLAAPAKK